MAITQSDFIDALSVHDAASLRAVLEEARFDAESCDTPRDYAERIATSLWWSYCTPLGFAIRNTSFDEIVEHVARKLKLDGALPEGSAWERLTAMTKMLVREDGPVALEDLDPKHRACLSPSWLPTASYATGASSSFGAMAVGKGIVFVSKTKVGSLLPLIPTVGPWVRTIYKGGGVAAVVGGPAGIALSILAANNALGTNYQRLVPLLLGVGTLEPGAVTDAVVVDSEAVPDPA